MRTHPKATGLIAALALCLAGCGSNAASTSRHHSASGGGAPHSSTTTASAPSTTSATATTTTTPTTPSTTTTTAKTTTSSSGGAGLSGGSGSACTAADLSPAFLNSNGATGHVVLAFTLKNTSSHSCHTYGFPGVEFLNAADGTIATDATRTTTDFAGHLAESEITLGPGQEASFRMVTSDVGSSQSACTTAYGLQVIAPDDTATMKVPITHGISVCNGKATVSPLVAGTGASST